MKKRNLTWKSKVLFEFTIDVNSEVGPHWTIIAYGKNYMEAIDKTREALLIRSTDVRFSVLSAKEVLVRGGEKK